MHLQQHVKLLPFALVMACTSVYSDPASDPSAKHGGSAKRVFATSTVYQGGLLGGLSGADAKCAGHARDAGLSGAFKAWLSDNTTSVVDRLSHSSSEYTLVDGTQVGSNWDDLIHAELRHAIDLDENGMPLPPIVDAMIGGPLWTGSDFDGQVYSDEFKQDWTCGDWSDLHEFGLVGDQRRTTEEWTKHIGLPCTMNAALYCIEQ